MFKFLTIVISYLTCFFFYSETVYCQSDPVPADSAQTILDSLPESNGAILIPDSIDFPVKDDILPSPNLRRVPDSIVKIYLHDPDFAYANDPVYWKEPAPAKPGISEKLLRLLFSKGFRISHFILFILLISYAIYRLAKENSFTWFRRSGKPDQGLRSAGAEEEIEGPADLDEAIRKSGEAGNYSLAVRYMYLKIIRAAFEKNAVLIKTSSTNADITKAFQDPRQAGDFRYLATAYEYIFYGGFLPSREQFDLLQKKFNLFHQNLGN